VILDLRRDKTIPHWANTPSCVATSSLHDPERDRTSLYGVSSLQAAADATRMQHPFVTARRNAARWRRGTTARNSQLESPMIDNEKRWVATMAFALLLTSCGGAGRPLKKGGDSYERQDYQSAMVQWRYLEAREGDMSDKARVRYLVYRGLTHYRLYQRSTDPTDEAAALHYLARGQAEYDAGKARWLSPDTVAQMKEALADLALRAADSPRRVVVVHAPPAPQPIVVSPSPRPRDDDD
jgi:hypothetical protein